MVLGKYRLFKSNLTINAINTFTYSIGQHLFSNLCQTTMAEIYELWQYKYQGSMV